MDTGNEGASLDTRGALAIAIGPSSHRAAWQRMRRTRPHVPRGLDLSPGGETAAGYT